MLGPVGALVAWALFHDSDNQLQVLGLGLAAGAGIGGYLTKPLWDQWLKERFQGSAAKPPTLSADERKDWQEYVRRNVLARRAKGEDSQLEQMVSHTPTVDVGLKERVMATHHEGRSRLKVGGRTLPWSQIAQEWDRAPGRMVILGDPGYGKTVAALTLLKHINASNSGEAEPVAELFPLVEWYRWRERHQGDCAAWIAHQLVTTYNVPPPVAHELVDSELVLPLFDGLDEVPESSRATCKQAIEAYAGSAAPFRSFVLTCRAREYQELAPDWVQADRQVALVGLQRAQLVTELEERTAGRPGWDAVTSRLTAGDSAVAELFRSPLRFAIALQAYRNRDPRELLDRSAQDAQGQLWEVFLGLEGAAALKAEPQQVRRWLAFIAAAMERNGRQRLWLHELYLYPLQREKEERRFRLMFGLVAGFLTGGIMFGPIGYMFLGDVASNPLVGVVCGRLHRVVRRGPAVREDGRLRAADAVAAPAAYAGGGRRPGPTGRTPAGTDHRPARSCGVDPAVLAAPPSQ
jgi:hypothetical protein